MDGFRGGIGIFDIGPIREERKEYPVYAEELVTQDKYTKYSTMRTIVTKALISVYVCVCVETSCCPRDKESTGEMK